MIKKVSVKGVVLSFWAFLNKENALCEVRQHRRNDTHLPKVRLKTQKVKKIAQN